MASVAPCPLIEVSGPPLERGRQHGRQAADRIRRGIADYSAQLARSGFGEGELRDAVAGYLPVIEGFDAHYVTEMQGIAEGAGVPFEQVVLLNARTELLQIASRRAREQQRANGEPVDDDPDGCTGVVVLPEAAAEGRLIHAQNWDWKAGCAETAIVLKVRRDDGPDYITFTEAGALGRFGFNALGIAITANYLECDRDYSQLGVPLALIRRKVLEQSEFALALRTVYTTAKSASNNIIVSHAQGIAIDFECAPDETFLVHPEHGLLVHANHWQSGVALSKLRDTGILSTPDSLYRDRRVHSLLSPHFGCITRAHVQGALFDRFADPWSVCRPPRKTLSSNLSATVAMIVMDPAAGTMDVAMLPALNREFSRFTLDTRYTPVATPVPV
ncbi:acyl-CoA--6-aminopenicillanic acid acyltransferase [Aquincola sp. S2]|uniref:Acyl-CoA--6-aminopenicillanic acid acyltransferase n=1 Tax=Pseudaquabacterium terrae TaxID=2732868 RepID=A0ABX2EJK7_9BURK|nr:C45 family peptidase [Aquabacterium terrae]NRF68788.1 acyl-CoA--6-aminopenicillanic acid acyltransferase [Aquabacterium terrae]